MYKHIMYLTYVFNLQEVGFIIIRLLRWLTGKQPACQAGEAGSIPGLGRCPGEGNDNHSSILPWEIPWTEEHGRLSP